MKSIYEKDLKQMRQQVYDAEFRLAQATELYAKEKIEKESNELVFRRMLERYNKSNNSNSYTYDTRRRFHKPTISVAGNSSGDSMIAPVDEDEVTLEYVQRLESEIAEKDKQIKQIKQKLINDSRRNSPVSFG
eukprot:TRINITY_DN14476_c0_g1_i10.p2 TRINITY_DN14476_c0_g1~~TRINITY_DN14476_c0_g1_i10.p2  ORF type:complete len:133 (+),score=44.12 TRINITY_DN14476_c0_g1_i10:193-591(+)